MRFSTVLFSGIEDRFDRFVKQSGDAKCQWQARIVLAGLDRIDRLARYFELSPVRLATNLLPHAVRAGGCSLVAIRRPDFRESVGDPLQRKYQRNAGRPLTSKTLATISSLLSDSQRPSSDARDRESFEVDRVVAIRRQPAPAAPSRELRTRSARWEQSQPSRARQSAHRPSVPSGHTQEYDHVVPDRQAQRRSSMSSGGVRRIGVLQCVNET